MHHLLGKSSLILKSLDAHSRRFHNIHGLSPIKALVTLNHSNELTPLLPVLDYELSEGKNCGCFFLFNLCISSAWHSTCLRVGIQHMFIPCLGILFLLSSIWASYFVHRHILSEQRGRERSRSYQKQKKETVKRTIYGSLWLTSGSHSLGLLKFIKPCNSKQKVSIWSLAYISELSFIKFNWWDYFRLIFLKGEIMLSIRRLHSNSEKCVNINIKCVLSHE